MSIGDAVLRTEDQHLITGRTSWTANLRPPGTLHLVFARSPVAHAKITVDVSPASSAPGVVAAWTGADVAHWCSALPRLDDDEPVFPVIATDTVRYVGEALAVIVARSAAEAVDAAEQVAVDYDDLPVVADVTAALADGAPQIHETVARNVVEQVTRSSGDVEQAFASADVVVRRQWEQPRVFPAAMEPRVVTVQPSADGFTVWLSTQAPHMVRYMLAEGTGIPAEQLRVIAPDVGGGFGGKFFYPEELVVLLAARALNRPVAWTSTRSEDLQTTFHGRALRQEVALAANSDGTLTALDVRLVSDVGAYSTPIGPGSALGAAKMYTGIYQIPSFRLRGESVLTNKTPVGAYRGAGRPEATYAIERIMDDLAAELGVDPVELRRKNWIRPEQFPYRTSGGMTYDVGDYAATTDAMLKLGDYDALRVRQTEVNGGGSPRRLGIGVSTYVEVCGGGAIKVNDEHVETSSVQLTPEGAQVTVGSSAFGTGHVTSWAQIVSGVLGIDVARVTVVQGDTAAAPHGFDSYGSRSLSVVGSAVYEAAVDVRAKAVEVAARLLECDAGDLEFDEGGFTVRGTAVTASLQDVVRASYDDRSLASDGLEPGLGCTRATNTDDATFPFGAHLAVVEVDIETGNVDVVDYVAVDDVGNVVNPPIVEGQVQGGIVQGIAQVLFEEAAFDELGNPMTPSFTEYAIPTAADVISMRTDRRVTPATTNPLGSKGVGEAGAIAAPPAVVNALLDALRPLGVVDIPIPATPYRVWQAIQEATPSSSFPDSSG